MSTLRSRWQRHERTHLYRLPARLHLENRTRRRRLVRHRQHLPPRPGVCRFGDDRAQAHHLLDRAQSFPGAPVLPVRVSADIPKDRIFDVMDALKTVTVSERIGRGDVVIPDVLGLGVDVIATSSLLRHRPE